MADIGANSIRIVELLVLLFFAWVSGVEDIYSNSHISPNSAKDEKVQSHTLPLITSSNIEALIVQGTIPEESETKKHVIVSRSVNQELPTKTDRLDDDILVFKHFEDQISHNDIELSGRLVNLIQPTKTHKDNGKMKKVSSTEAQSFPGEVQGAPQGRALQEPQTVSPTAVTTPSFVTVAPDLTKGRQASPDIQDIITGIVKLLNGNVNVQANTALPALGRPLRPISTRINNRGPPRITDVPPLPPDLDIAAPLPPPPAENMFPPSGTTKQPTPYPFEIPELPQKPYLNGIPIPEQIVPINANRPGVRRPVSVPSWKRPQRRPPPGPIMRPPAYKPLPLFEDSSATFSNSSQDILTLNLGSDMQIIPITDDPSLDTLMQNSELNSSEVTTLSEIETPISTEKEHKDKDIQMEKKKDKEKNSSKMDKYNSKFIVSTSSEVNEKTKEVTVTPTTSVTSSSVVAINETSNSSSNAFTKLGEGTGDATPLLESSIQEITTTIINTTTSLMTTTTTTATEELPSLKLTASSDIQTQTSNISSDKISSTTKTEDSSTGFQYYPYRPRPGIVLDDTEYKPGGHRSPPVITARPVIGQIGEIFDVTVSAIQGPSGSGSGSISGGSGKPYIIPVDIEEIHGTQTKDVITAPSGTENFVSIDGKRTYLNLFGDPTSTSSIQPTTVKPVSSSVSATGYAVPHTENLRPKPSQRRPVFNRRPSQPTVRIDTCIVGDASTCDQAQNEQCRTEHGVSSCHCRPGFARRKHREPCRKTVSVLMSLRVDRLYEHKISWTSNLSDNTSEEYQQLAYETVRAIDSAMSMTPFSDEFMTAKVNSIYKGERSAGQAGVFVNATLQLEENIETSRPQVRADIQKHLLGVIQRRSNNVGNSAIWVDSPPGSVSNLQDVDECSNSELHDCHALAKCINTFGSFQCECLEGYKDPWLDNRHRAGRHCEKCSPQYCSNRGECKYAQGQQICVCTGNYYGSQCEVDGEVLGVAVGASVAAIVIIILTLVCLVMWSRKWNREHKTAVGSPVFGYMATGGSTVKTPNVGGPPYQVSIEDRLRWAQIADVMAQANHYGPDPATLPTRPSSAIFTYPSLGLHPALGGNGGTLPPVPMPRLTLQSRAASVHAMRQMDNNSTSSEEEDRADLLGRSFQVPRPKSRTSLANQSGIYYDVDYDQNDIYKHVPGPGIPMSTYTAGRPPFYRN